VANVNDTARLGLAVLNSYGLSVEHLERVFDVLFATVRGGVTTIPELAGSLARVLPTARAAGVPFEELAAALATLTRAFGGQTAEAVTALNSAIVQLAAPTDEARRHMAELGIEWNGLIGTIRQIGERNLGLAAVRQIIPDIEGAKAVMTLAGNYEQLAQRLRETDQAAGAMQTAFEFVAEDDAAAVERLGAAWAELLRALGETLAVFTPVLDALAGLLRGFNELHPLVRGAAVFLAAFALAWRPLKVVVDLVVTSLRAFPGAFAGFRAGGLASLASVKSAFALFYAAVAGWSIGSYLRQEFAAAERAGVALVAGLLKGWARIEYAWARIQAIFRGGAARARAELEAQLRDVDDWATERFIEIARRGRHAAEAGRLPAPAVAPGTGESEAAGQRRDAELERRRRDAELQRERDAAQRLADAQRDLVATLADQADRLSAETIAREIERNREAWDARTISAEQYYARLTELQRQQVELELQALARRRQGAAVDEAGARARGDEPAALAAQGVIARIDTDIELARRRLAELQREAGVGLAAAQTARLRDQAQALASQIDAQFAALARREEQLRNQVELGLPQRAAEAQVNAARRETLGITAALVAQLEELVALQPELFGPDMLERIERFRTGLGQIGVVADSVAVRINDALGQSLERLFADIAQGTATLGDALRGFLRSIVAAINQQLSRELAQGIMRAFDASGGAQGGAGGLGGWISGLLRSWFDGGDGFARGGYTGPGHRLQPAGVVHAGEYVFPADAVRRLGVQSLAALHRFASGAFVPLGPRLSYADGGAVQLPAAAAGAAPQSIRIVNTVDPELARDYLESAAGERVIVNAITRNAGAVRMMLQG
jgi:TP901 family phage tail tape measure protein